MQRPSLGLFMLSCKYFFHLIILITNNVIVWNFRTGMSEPGGQRGARPRPPAPPPIFFYRSVNPISTIEIMPPTLVVAPSRFSDLPPSLQKLTRPPTLARIIRATTFNFFINHNDFLLNKPGFHWRYFLHGWPGKSQFRRPYC